MTELVGWVELPISREDILFAPKPRATRPRSYEDGSPEQIIMLRASAFAKLVVAHQQAQQGAEMIGRLGRVIAARDAERAEPSKHVHTEAELAAVRDHVGEESADAGPQTDAERRRTEFTYEGPEPTRTGLYDALNLWASRNPGEKLPPGRYLIGNSGEILPDRINPRRLLKFTVREDGAVINSSGQPAITPSEYGKAIPERERSRLRPRPVRDAPQA